VRGPSREGTQPKQAHDKRPGNRVGGWVGVGSGFGRGGGFEPVVRDTLLVRGS
jgi:hypothetical protein